MPRRLAVFCDGTWNKPEQQDDGRPAPTNVHKLCEQVHDVGDDGIEQVTTYLPGVGTRPLENILGGAFGFGLSRNVKEAYRFLVETYRPGDELFLFGFSRGAFTARSLAGLCRNVGILRPEHAGLIDLAYRIYRRRDDGPDTPDAISFRETYSHEHPGVRFMGVWDTVGSLGIPLSGVPLFDLINKRWRFHDVVLSTKVQTARQALSVDERRGAFEPAIWEPKDGETFIGRDVEQVWFAGVHKDVGGGYADASLSEIPLLWMAKEAHGAGLRFQDTAFADVAPDPIGAQHDSMRLLYRALPKLVRRFGEDDPSQQVAATVRMRFDGISGCAQRIPPTVDAALTAGRVLDVPLTVAPSLV